VHAHDPPPAAAARALKDVKGEQELIVCFY
jgi:hypothetical protein